jgi:hypothetical protein
LPGLHPDGDFLQLAAQLRLDIAIQRQQRARPQDVIVCRRRPQQDRLLGAQEIGAAGSDIFLGAGYARGRAAA